MESFIVRFNILDDIACITNTIEKDTEYTPVVSIVIELFNGFRVVPLAGPGMVKLIFVLTTAEKPIPTSEVIVPNMGRIPKPVAPVGYSYSDSGRVYYSNSGKTCSAGRLYDSSRSGGECKWWN